MLLRIDRLDLSEMLYAMDVNTISGDCFANSAIRCCFVDTFLNSDALIVFPPNDSKIRYPPFPLQDPSGWVLLLHRYYAGITTTATLSAALRFLRLAVPSLCPHCFALPVPENFAQKAWSCSPVIPNGCPDGRWQSLPGSWETSCAFALLSDPGKIKIPGQYSILMLLPPYKRRKLLRFIQFRGSITQLLHSLSTLHGMSRLSILQDSLPAVDQTLPDRSLPPVSFHLTVSASLHPPLTRLRLAQLQ